MASATSSTKRTTIRAARRCTAGQTGYVDEAFAFTGRWFDKATGLQNNLNRWYDPQIGRWLSEDPISFAGGDANLYRYVGNQPTGYIDPNGLVYPVHPMPPRPGWHKNWGQPPNAKIADRPKPPTPPPTFPGYGFDDRPIQSVVGPGDALAAAAAEVPCALYYGFKQLIGGDSQGAQRNWRLGGNKTAQKWANQMRQRGWTPEQIDEALSHGRSCPATNNVNPTNPAIRYINPTTGQSVVIDAQTGEIIHVGGPGFIY